MKISMYRFYKQPHTVSPRDKECRAEAGRFFGFNILLSVSVSILFCVSCVTTEQPEVSLPVEVPNAFTMEGEVRVPAQWWHVFESEQLNKLIDQALADNFTLKMAWSRLEQAAAIAQKAGSEQTPELIAKATGGRRVTRTPLMGRSYATDLELGLRASYEVDLWGRIQASVDAAESDVDVSREDLQAAAITVSSAIATTWLQLIERREQLQLLDEQIATNQKYLRVITGRFRRGRADASDVLQQRQLVEKRRGERYLVEATIQTLHNQLAVLSGRSPGTFTMPGGEHQAFLPELPPRPDPGLPAELLQRRPDVRQAEAAVFAADRRVAEAVSDRFPRLTLTAAVDTSTADIQDLFDNWLASIAAQAVAPLIDGGRRRAEVSRTEAVLNHALYNYGQTVIEAVQEVNDALVREHRQKEYLRSLKQQLDLAGSTTRQTRANYVKGAMDFTRYLTTLLEYQRLERDTSRAELELLLERVGLYRALAGSWPLPEPNDLQD